MGTSVLDEGVEIITISVYSVKIVRKFSEFVWGDAPRRATKLFGNYGPRQRDEFCPKIVEVGAILAIFRPFEMFRTFVHLMGL